MTTSHPRWRWLRWAMPGPTGFESSRQLLKWLLLGSVIGCVAGLGAVVFYGGIQLATRLFLEGIAGYRPPGPAGEGAAVVTPIAHRWLIPVVTTLGGFVSGLLVFKLAPEAEGHGTDAAIDAIHRHGGDIRPRVVPVKILASAITIGTGGSAGREGPAAQISAGFASMLGRWVLADTNERRILVAAGIGSGIGAIFRAPLGGAVLAAEILYTHDIEVEAIIPSLIASIVGYTIYGAWYGFGPIFGPHPTLELGSPIQLVYYAALGLLSGIGGTLYARSFYGLTALFQRLAIPRVVKPALGGLVVGLIGLALPQVLHTGYGWVQLAMTRPGLLTFTPTLLVAIVLGKILATSLSIGSGGSGGIFGPGMVIGGMLGALLWRVAFGVLPDVPPDPGAFVIIGMMALFGAIAHAPLAVMLMVAEMTGTLSLLAPAMIAVALATAIVGDETIYRAQLRDRTSSPAHRVKVSIPMLAALRVRDAMKRLPESPPETASAVVLDPEQTLEDAMQALVQRGADTGIVMEHGDPVGVVTWHTILRAYRLAREARLRGERPSRAVRATSSAGEDAARGGR